MHKILTSRIQIPWLTGLIVASSLVTGITYLLEGRDRGAFGTLCGEIAYFFGPLFCVFLWILLASKIIWQHEEDIHGLYSLVVCLDSAHFIFGSMNLVIIDQLPNTYQARTVNR